MTNEHKRDVVASSLDAYTEEVIQLTKDGWIVVEGTYDVGHYGGYYTVSMTRDDVSVRAFKEYAEGVASAPKLTRAEILANARAAKAAKIDVNKITE